MVAFDAVGTDDQICRQQTGFDIAPSRRPSHSFRAILAQGLPPHANDVVTVAGIASQSHS